MKKKIDCTQMIEIERDRLQISFVMLSKSKLDVIKLHAFHTSYTKLCKLHSLFYKKQSSLAKAECSYAHLSPNLYLVCCFP